MPHATLTASSVSTINLNSQYYRKIEIVNRGDVEAFYTLDDSTPTVEGDNSIVLPARSAVVEEWYGDTTPTVKIISTGTPKISVRGV